jgi:hypothetical protein
LYFFFYIQLEDKFFVIPALQVMAYEDHDPDAPYQLGLMYYTMPGKDPKGALPWFLISSSRNGSKGDFMLGEMYRKGKGVERDCLVSLQWHLKAAKDNMHSWIKIAHLLYRGGEGVPKDNYKALAWFYRHDPQSRMVKHLNERHCHLKETDKSKFGCKMIMLPKKKKKIIHPRWPV